MTLRKEVAEQLGIKPGDEMEVGHEPEANEFRYRPAEEFEGGGERTDLFCPDIQYRLYQSVDFSYDLIGLVFVL